MDPRDGWDIPGLSDAATESDLEDAMAAVRESQARRSSKLSASSSVLLNDGGNAASPPAMSTTIDKGAIGTDRSTDLNGHGSAAARRGVDCEPLEAKWCRVGTQIAVIVPHGAQEGQVLMVRLSSGQLVPRTEIVVPQGKKPGESFKVVLQ